MNLIDLKKNNARLKCYINIYERAIRSKLDVRKRIEIEDSKPLIESYLLVPKEWYIKESNRLNRLISWISNRIEITTKKIKV